MKSSALRSTASTLSGCEGVARVDIMLEEGTDALFVLEINTIPPGMTATSLLPKQPRSQGSVFNDVVSLILEAARGSRWSCRGERIVRRLSVIRVEKPFNRVLLAALTVIGLGDLWLVFYTGVFSIERVVWRATASSRMATSGKERASSGLEPRHGSVRRIVSTNSRKSRDQSARMKSDSFIRS